jgi:hypothetical protein
MMLYWIRRWDNLDAGFVTITADSPREALQKLFQIVGDTRQILYEEDCQGKVHTFTVQDGWMFSVEEVQQ